MIGLLMFIIYYLFQIVGIITRHNLTHEFLVAKLRQHYITIWSDSGRPAVLPVQTLFSQVLSLC